MCYWTEWSTNTWLYKTMFNRTTDPLENGIRHLRSVQKKWKGMCCIRPVSLSLSLHFHFYQHRHRKYLLISFLYLICNLIQQRKCSGNEKTANSNSIDQKTMLHTDDPVCSDVSLHNKNSLDSGRSPMLTSIEPVNQVGGQLLSPNEVNVSIFMDSS